MLKLTTKILPSPALRAGEGLREGVFRLKSIKILDVNLFPQTAEENPLLELLGGVVLSFYPMGSVRFYFTRFYYYPLIERG